MELTKDNLPVSSISVIITGFVVEHIQNDKYIKIVYHLREGKRFYIKHGYFG